MNNQKKKKSGGTGAAIAILLVIVLPRLLAALDSSKVQYMIWRARRWLMRSGLDPELLPLYVGIAVVFIVGLIVVLKSAAKRKAAVSDGAPERVRINTADGRTSAAKQRPDPRSRSFTPPEPSCIVCDHTGEDHFLRDKAQRIAQLDEWLKNGLIDRGEYRVLRDRYERDL